jgi:hypothetical protein
VGWDSGGQKYKPPNHTLAFLLHFHRLRHFWSWSVFSECPGRPRTGAIASRCSAQVGNERSPGRGPGTDKPRDRCFYLNPPVTNGELHQQRAWRQLDGHLQKIKPAPPTGYGRGAWSASGAQTRSCHCDGVSMALEGPGSCGPLTTPDTFQGEAKKCVTWANVLCSAQPLVSWATLGEFLTSLSLVFTSLKWC